MAIARKRAMAYMKMACAEINLTCHPKVNFSNRNDKMAMFLFDLTDVEVFLIAAIMYRNYIASDIAYLKTLSRDYTSTELRVFSPSEARQSFMEMYNSVCFQVDAYMDAYKNTDRETLEFIDIDYSAYESEE